MTNNFKLAAAFTPALPLSLLADANVASSLTRLPDVLPSSEATAQADLRLERIASIRIRIAKGTYRVSAMQLADCMVDTIFTA